MLILLVAVAGGIAIGFQATLMNRVSQEIDAIPTGFLVNMMGGVAAGVLLFMAFRLTDSIDGAATSRMVPFALMAGSLGIFIVATGAFALPRIGIAATLAGFLLGQMAVAVIVDATGIGGDAIPIDPRRIMGLLALVLAVWLLLPRSS